MQKREREKIVRERHRKRPSIEKEKARGKATRRKE